ncbi:MAG: electron transfer flavoprotein subunit alpha/FixB family protein [Candidatus Adiutrix sp.]|jgi:electron transfer flavoprotein alpha subunit|nr:electron transfer flavoprotein subunit alpha/FixB family protein [Candidatus Adiutrix sp.]
MADIYIYSDKPDVAAEITGFVKREKKKAILLAESKEAADVLKKLGADAVLLISGDGRRINDYAEAIAGLTKAKGGLLLAVGSTVAGRELGASVAGRLGCAMISDVRAARFEGDVLCAEKMTFGGAVIHAEKMSGFGVISVPAGVFEKADPAECGVEEVPLPADARISLIKTQPVVKQGVDLSKAQKIVSIGLGVNKEEDIQIARDLAEVLGAEIGCSRSIAEDRKWLPDYIGMTGVTVKPQLYFAMGLSGQIQHVFGIRDSKLIVAVDTNDKAPIFRAADYGIVGDLYEVVPMLTEAIKKL